MHAGLVLVFALVAASAPLVGAEPFLLPGAQVQSGPASVSIDGDEVEVVTDLPRGLGVDKDLRLPILPDLSIESEADRAADEESLPSPSATSSGPLEVLKDVHPKLALVGSSLLATILAVATWLAKPSLGMFSRIEDDALATHPMRRQALDLIAANPGATVQDIRRGLGIAWGTAVYHLGRLERAGLVAVRHSEGRRGHWPLGQAPAKDALAPTGEALARLVSERPGLPQNELARLAGIGPPAACKQLRRLESAGFVEARRSGKARLYLPTSSLEGMLARTSAVEPSVPDLSRQPVEIHAAGQQDTPFASCS